VIEFGVAADDKWASAALALNMAVTTYSALDIVSYAIFGALRG
jgi:hypothetical protein